MVSMYKSLKLKCFVLVPRTAVAHLPVGITDKDLAQVDPVIKAYPCNLCQYKLCWFNSNVANSSAQYT